MNKKPVITDKQKLAVDLYFSNGLNMKKALLDAGFSESTAKGTTAFKNKPAVKEYIQQRRDAIQSESVANETEIMEALTQIIRREQQDYAVLPDGTMVQYQVSTADQLRAIKEAMKYYGMDKNDNTVDVKVQTLIYGQDPNQQALAEGNEEDYITL